MKIHRFSALGEVGSSIVGREGFDRAPPPQSEQDRLKVAAIRAMVDGKAMFDGVTLVRKEPEIVEVRGE